MTHPIELYRHKDNKEILLDINQLINREWAKVDYDNLKYIITNKDIEYVGKFDVINYT